LHLPSKLCAVWAERTCRTTLWPTIYYKEVSHLLPTSYRLVILASNAGLRHILVRPLSVTERVLPQPLTRHCCCFSLHLLLSS